MPTYVRLCECSHRKTQHIVGVTEGACAACSCEGWKGTTVYTDLAAERAVLERPHDDGCLALVPDFDSRDCNCSRLTDRLAIRQSLTSSVIGPLLPDEIVVPTKVHEDGCASAARDGEMRYCDCTRRVELLERANGGIVATDHPYLI